MCRIIVVACILLLRAPGTFCQEQSAPLFPLPSCGDFHRDLSAPRGLLTMDLHLFAAGDTQAAGGSSSGSQPQGNNPRQGHSYPIELTSANWRPLSHSEKFSLFSRDLLQWETHLSLGIDAGLS